VKVSLFLFSWNFRSSKTKNGGVAMDEPSQGSASGPVDHSWGRAFCYRLAVLYKLFGLLFKC